jgi:signal peptidase II
VSERSGAAVVPSFRYFPLALVAAVVVAALDQASKWWVVEKLMQPPRLVPLTPFLDLVLVRNNGISFGLFNTGGAAQPIVFTALAVLIAVGLLVWLRSVTRGWVALAIGAILGGAVGNVLDRLRLGSVVDFVDAHLGDWHWPVFNVADSAICVAVAVIAVDALFGAKE